MVSREQRHVVANLVNAPHRLRSCIAARTRRHRGECQARPEDVHAREVARVVLAGNGVDDVGQIIHLVHLPGDLIEARVSEHITVLGNGAEGLDVHVVRLAVIVVVRGGPGDGVAHFVLAGIPDHQRLLVIELCVALDGVHPEVARQVECTRMVRVDGSGREFSGRQERHQCVQLIEESLRNEDARVLLLLLDGAEKEHLVPDQWTADRATVLLPAERRFRAIGLLREIVLRCQLPIALITECRSMELIGARFRHEGNRRTARTPVGG